MNLFIVESHILYTNKGENHGPAHDVYEYLVKNKICTYFIKHDLFGIKNSVVTNDKNKVIYKEKLGVNLIIRYINEIKFNIQNLAKIKRKSNPSKITLISIDPINGISGVILKIFGFKGKFIYFTVDYADRRFSNSILNIVYHLLDRISLKFADEIWSVSSRIVKKRLDQGVRTSKLKLIPNSPIFKESSRMLIIEKTKLVSVSHLTKSFDIESLIKIMKIILMKHKNISLTIVGSGPEEKTIQDKVIQAGLKNKIRLVGQKSHEESLKLIRQSFLGFAIYTEENSWNKYGDSMKAREYVSCGVPVIINTIPSTADDVKEYNAGFVFNKIDPSKIAAFISRCIEDNNYYLLLKNNSLRMAREFSKDCILQEIINYE